MEYSLNDKLTAKKNLITYFEHIVPHMPESRMRDSLQRERVIAAEIQWIKARLDVTKFKQAGPEMVEAWKKFM